MNLSGRIALMHRGEIMGIVRPGEVTPEELGLMMADTHAFTHPSTIESSP